MAFVPSLRFLLIIGCVCAVAGLVVLLVVLLKPKNSGAPVGVPAQETYSGYGNTAKIFVNGGAPSGTNALGRITVNGRTLPVLYSELPLEITLPVGRHHVTVEGGVYGDARIDRVIDLGALDVWTVDLSGQNDPDLIKHQMISYSEYTKALVNFGYRLTKIQL